MILKWLYPPIHSHDHIFKTPYPILWWRNWLTKKYFWKTQKQLIFLTPFSAFHFFHLQNHFLFLCAYIHKKNIKIFLRTNIQNKKISKIIKIIQTKNSKLIDYYLNILDITLRLWVRITLFDKKLNEKNNTRHSEA